ncbi:MAG: hypothetical protein HS101_11080 [Planctomycetia bacterium]|nr:hypothetical protein [Planctomycetia bacterium]MCC7315848.1 NF038122 family metalloprotease [Planctomycetota bacterium]
MSNRVITPTVITILMALITAPAQAHDGTTPEAAMPQPSGIRQDALVFVRPLPPAEATDPVTGKKFLLPRQSVLRPMCGSDVSRVSVVDLARWDREITAVFAANGLAELAEQDSGANPRGAAVDVIFNLDGSVPPAAVTAFATVEAYIESIWGDPISFTVNVNFADLGGGIIGATGSNYVLHTYPVARDGLINGKDLDDTIQDFLPSGSTIPVKYNAFGSATNEDRVFVTVANSRAAIGPVGGSAASMTFNSSFNFDFDPSNGITGGTTDFQSVAIHEVGHAMGFTSGVDFRTNDIELLDFYRFRRTAENPSNTTEFQTFARLAHFNTPDDDHNSDIVSAEYRMSDGDPRQASHFREGVDAIMDPTLAPGQTFFPNFYRIADRNMFDAIGWDFPASPADVTPPQPEPMTFSSNPAALSTSSITMTATIATDATNPVQYFFEETTGGPGGTTSGWQTPNSYVDAGLNANTLYAYRVKARDAVLPTPNENTFSEIEDAATLIQTPSGIAFFNVTNDSAQVTATGAFTNLNAGMSGIYFDVSPPGPYGNAFTWIQSNTTTITGLLAGQSYIVKAKARNQDGIETAFGSSSQIDTIPFIGDCNNDGLLNVEGDIPCFVDALLGIDIPEGAIFRSDLNFDGFTDGLDVQEMVNCFVFGCN